MFVNRSRNKSGTVSVRVLQKRGRNNVLIKSFGSSRDEKEIDRLVAKAREFIQHQTGTFYHLFNQPAEQDIDDFVDSLSNSQVSVDGVEGDDLHLIHVGTAVGTDVFLVDLDVENLPKEHITTLLFAGFLQDAAFHGHGKYVEYRSIDLLALDGFPSGFINLMRLFAATDHADVIGCYHGLFSGESHGKLAATGEIVGGGLFWLCLRAKLIKFPQTRNAHSRSPAAWR